MTLQDMKFEIKWLFRQLMQPFRDMAERQKAAQQRKASAEAQSYASPWFQTFLDRMAQYDIADRSVLRGCRPDEIEALEQKLGVRLPSVYREYLLLMGRKSGRLFAHDHLAVFYPHVQTATDDALSWYVHQKWMKDRVPPVPDAFEWPDEGVFIQSRLGEDWHFIRCTDAGDSPVWMIDGTNWEIRQVHASVQDWLSDNMDACRAAIEAGYFYEQAYGTQP